MIGVSIGKDMDNLPVLDIIPLNQVESKSAEPGHFRIFVRNVHGKIEEETAFLIESDKRKAYIRQSENSDHNLHPENHNIIFANSVKRTNEQVNDMYVYSWPESVVIKVFLSDGADETEKHKQEVAAMAEAGDCRHVMDYSAYLLDEEGVAYIVTPYCSGGSLFEHIPWAWEDDEIGGLPENDCQLIATTLLRNLRYLQMHRMCHLHISPETILMWKAGDFSCMPMTNFSHSVQLCTPAPHKIESPNFTFRNHKAHFQSPEIYQNQAFDPKAADVWSVGAILFSALTGMTLYEKPVPEDSSFHLFVVSAGLVSDEILQQYQNHWAGKEELPPLLKRIRVVQTLNKNTRSFLGRLLNPIPSSRATVEALLGSDWLMGSDARRREWLWEKFRSMK